ncbi:Hypothetical predicted protein [Lecanosticta acicola]|uniref:Uncharacterized protein n=1 Tax=Lecanosticta acicola TaxID=111012 RepID=A0AAI9EE45_9PEZI|nr:Hypothetical predicted protein [Lecanosticta acicola]
MEAPPVPDVAYGTKNLPAADLLAKKGNIAYPDEVKSFLYEAYGPYNPSKGKSRPTASALAKILHDQRMNALTAPPGNQITGHQALDLIVIERLVNRCKADAPFREVADLTTDQEGDTWSRYYERVWEEYIQRYHGPPPPPAEDERKMKRRLQVKGEARDIWQDVGDGAEEDICTGEKIPGPLPCPPYGQTSEAVGYSGPGDGDAEEAGLLEMVAALKLATKGAQKRAREEKQTLVNKIVEAAREK